MACDHWVSRSAAAGTHLGAPLAGVRPCDAGATCGLSPRTVDAWLELVLAASPASALLLEPRRGEQGRQSVRQRVSDSLVLRCCVGLAVSQVWLGRRLQVEPAAGGAVRVRLPLTAVCWVPGGASLPDLAQAISPAVKLQAAWEVLQAACGERQP